MASKVADAVMEGKQRLQDKAEGRVAAAHAKAEEATGEKPSNISVPEMTAEAAAPEKTEG